MKLKYILPLAVAMAALSTNTAVADEATSSAPKYIFYFIGDGMGMGPSVATEMYNRQVLGNDQPITMMQFPVSGFCLTYSASSPVTDSAAAGTALSTGHKTKNGMLGMNPDTAAVYSMARVLQADGYGIGIATTVAPDDATPGAFYAHVPNRSQYYQIGVQAAESGYQFIAGAGLRAKTDLNGNPSDLEEVMAANGVQVVRGPKGISEINSEKVLLLNTEGTEPHNVGYTIDSIPNVLTLPMITQACLDHLEKVSPDKFFMMIEGGNIDHALHANDGAAAIIEILNFNEALDIAYKFYQAHPKETLIVVTADHDTGGMSIGNKAQGYWANLDYVNYQKVSKEQFERYCRNLMKTRRAYTWDDMKEYLEENLGFWKHVKITEEQEKALRDQFESTFELRNSADEKTLYASFNAFAKEVFKVYSDAAGFGFIATSHTGNPVPVFAIGDGSEAFSHLNNNIEIPATILRIAGK